MALEAQREVERKYDVSAEIQLPDLNSVAGITLVDSQKPVDLEAIYFDTPDHVLRRNRITLRRRTGGPDAGWHVKFPSGESRIELHAPLDTGADIEMPQEIRDVVAVFVREKTLQRTATLKTSRTFHYLHAGEEIVAEVCDDIVTSVSASAQVKRWREWEVELENGSSLDEKQRDALLDEVEEKLIAAGAHRSLRASKLSFALGPLPEIEERNIGKKGSLRAVLTLAFHSAASGLALWDPRVRRGEPDALHQLRVSVRTFRGLLKVTRKIVDKERARALSAQLRVTGQALGTARDAEVHLEILEERVDRWNRDTVSEQAIARLRTRLETEQETALAAALEHLRSPEYFATLDAVDAFLAEIPLNSKYDAAAKARGPLRLAVDRQVARIKTHVESAAAISEGDEWIHLLHEARKEAKTLRYMIRHLEDVPGSDLGGRRKALRVRAEGLQNGLGEHRDSLAFQTFVRSVAREAAAAGEETFSYGVLYAAEQEIQDFALERVRDGLKKL
ncbi:CYTH and CHAD domain-containing protein [Neomicrococcus lactis]|uniref:CYTH and CHAD domain-containing protein n=1 Tax=Neomicrococcus lactis TaxID=732241 RepID=UPI002301909E|nr:CYTH and CHAD domain-containing protein [Neomicrococcus lactis]